MQYFGSYWPQINWPQPLQQTANQCQPNRTDQQSIKVEQPQQEEYRLVQLGMKDIVLAAVILGGIYYMTRTDIRQSSSQLRKNLQTLKSWAEEPTSSAAQKAASTQVNSTSESTKATQPDTTTTPPKDTGGPGSGTT